MAIGGSLRLGRLGGGAGCARRGESNAAASLVVLLATIHLCMVGQRLYVYIHGVPGIFQIKRSGVAKVLAHDKQN